MKPRTFIILLLYILCGTISRGQCKSSSFQWRISPKLYNNFVDSNSEVTFWGNYFNNRGKDLLPDFFPDTLLIEIVLIPSIRIDLEGLRDESARLKVELILKYGDWSESKNVINPQYSDPIIIIDSVLNLADCLKKIRVNIGSQLVVQTVKVPLLRWFHSLDVFTYTEKWDWMQPQLCHYANQIIIRSSFSSNGSIIASSEYSLPVGGCGNEIELDQEF